MSHFKVIFDYLIQGGFVAYPLVLLFIAIAYCGGYRFSVLFSGRKVSVRSLVKNNNSFENSIQSKYLKELTLYPNLSDDQLTTYMDEQLVKFQMLLEKFSSVINTAVVLAPLLGLLGTVVGMIETFASLSNADLFATTGGIAGGISQALISTQLGLIVAIPGVFFARFLTQMEKKTKQDLYQINELVIQNNRD